MIRVSESGSAYIRNNLGHFLPKAYLVTATASQLDSAASQRQQLASAILNARFHYMSLSPPAAERTYLKLVHSACSDFAVVSAVRRMPSGGGPDGRACTAFGYMRFHVLYSRANPAAPAAGVGLESIAASAATLSQTDALLHLGSDRCLLESFETLDQIAELAIADISASHCSGLAGGSVAVLQETCPGRDASYHVLRASNVR